MARGLIRKPSFSKVVGAYRSQWKRFWLRLFTFGAYGRKGMGWLFDPKKAWYNFWYNRTSVSMYRLFGLKPSRLACFFAMIVATVVTPIDIAAAGIEAHEIKKDGKKKATEEAKAKTEASGEPVGGEGANSTARAKEAESKTVTKAVKTERVANAPSERKQTAPATSEPVVEPTPARTEPPKEKEAPRYTYTPVYGSNAGKVTPKVTEAPPKEPDESTPKSKPKHENDQYVRKRMIIDGTDGCSAELLAQIGIGTYLGIEADTDDPFDKDAVKLTLGGERIGWIGKTDRAAYVTCLRLKRKIYGVVTDIKVNGSDSKYEIETWFDSEC